MELLSQLYSISSPSRQEKEMRTFIKKYITSRGLADSVTVDDSGNLLVAKGVSDSYPCIACHMDEVCPDKGKFLSYMVDGKIFGFDTASMQQVGIGGDDKNGIWIALKLLESCDAMKAAFFVGEECGCVGSSAVSLEFFKDCRFIVEADRRNGGDIITGGGWYPWVTDEFLDDLLPIGREYGYAVADGLTTDVDELTSRGVGICCINISCGYYSPHSTHDYTIVSELKNALEFANAIFARMENVYPHVVEALAGGYWDYGWGRSGSSESGDRAKDNELWHCECEMYQYMIDMGEAFSISEFIAEYSSLFPHLKYSDFLDVLKTIDSWRSSKIRY